MPEPNVLTVAELTRQVRQQIESRFWNVWVKGEVSNCTRAGSGHIYFTLKDEDAQLRAVVWRTAAQRLRFKIEDGLQVVASGPLEVYEARGTYQLTVEQLVPQGLGPLELAFRQLHDRLKAEGLFAPERKRPLPKFPRRIALITSPSSAAVRDMLQVITRRWQAAEILLLPVSVQGEAAAGEIAAAFRKLQRLPQIDVVITGRGGGSLEDLWAFNEELVARAIAACPIPVISAVGHEIDISIADLVADRRALTPSEAGELVVPDRNDVVAECLQLRRRLVAGLRGRAVQSRVRLQSLADRRIFQRPRELLHDRARKLDELEAQLKRALARKLEHAQQQVALLSGSLDALSPLRVLGRGYSLTQRTASGELVRDAATLQPGDQIDTVLEAGRVTSRVEILHPSSHPTSASSPE